MLDLVALGTVADCVILDNNNRILVDDLEDIGIEDDGEELYFKGKDDKGLKTEIYHNASDVSTFNLIYFSGGYFLPFNFYA